MASGWRKVRIRVLGRTVLRGERAPSLLEFSHRNRESGPERPLEFGQYAHVLEHRVCGHAFGVVRSSKPEARTAYTRVADRVCAPGFVPVGGAVALPMIA